MLKGKTIAGARVYTNQAAATWVEELPVILIYVKSEDVIKFNQAPRELRYDMQVVIEIIAKGTEAPFADDDTTVEDILDDIIEVVKCVMARSETLDGTADDSILTAIEFDFVGDGQKPVGAARMVYNVTYVEASPQETCPQEGLGDFETVNVDYNLDGDEDIDANDLFEIPQ